MMMVAAAVVAGNVVFAEMAAFTPEEKTYAPRFQCATPAELGLSAPVTRSLDGVWKLAKVEVAKTAFPDEPSAEELKRKESAFDDTQWFDQEVPYDLYCCAAYPKRKNMWPNVDFPYSCAWYRRSFEVTDAEAKGAAYLHFGAVAWKSIVYLNGVEVGRHRGEFTSFDLKATGLLRPGKNTLAVRVLSDLGPRISTGLIKEADHPYGCQWWIATYRGGITESIELRLAPKAAFESIRTTPRPDEGVLEVDWRASAALEGGEIEARIVDAAKKSGGKVLGKFKSAAVTGSSGTIRIPVAKEIVPWEIGDAHLYYVELVARQGGEQIAADVSRFGWRKIEIKDGGFYLNGRRRFLFGANINSIDYIRYGDPSKPPHLDRVETFEKIDAKIDNFFTHALAGGTVIARTAHQPISERVLSAADEYGYMILYENGWCFSSKLKFPEFRDHSLAEMKEMLEIAYRHPSVAGFSLGNEVPYYHPKAAPLEVEMYDYLKANDKHGRPVSPQSGDFSGNTFVKTDLCDFHDYIGQATDWLGTRKNLDDGRTFKEKKYKDPELFNTRAIALGFETVGYTWGVNEDKDFVRGDLKKYLAYTKKQACWGAPQGIGCAGTVPLFMAVGPDASSACLAWMAKRVFEVIRNHGWWQGFAAWSATPFHYWRRWTQEIYPTLALPGGDLPPTHPFADEPTEYTVRVHNSQDAALAGVKLAVTLAFPDNTEKPLGEIAVPDLAPFKSFEGKTTLVFPAADTAQLRLRVLKDGKTLGQNFYDISSRSRKAVNAPRVKPREAQLLVTDSAANVQATAALLARYGVKAAEIKSLDEAKENAVVVIPFEKENQGVELPDTTMKTLGEKGVTVLMFEQNSSAAFLPGGMNLFEGSLSFSDMVLPQHPVFKGLSWTDFDVWNNAHQGKVVKYYVGPANATILACHGGTLYRPKNIGATLLEGKVGKGRLIINQLLAVDSAESDSAAAQYLRNLLDYVFTAAPVEAQELKLKLDSDKKGELVPIPMEPVVLKGDKEPTKPARATVKVGAKYAKIRAVHSAGFPNKIDKVMTYRIHLKGVKAVDWTIECGRTVADVETRVRPLAAKPVQLGNGKWGYEAVWENPYEENEIEKIEIIAQSEFKGTGADWQEVTFPVPYVWSLTGEKAIPETGWLESTSVGVMGQQFGWKGPANRAMKAYAAATGKDFAFVAYKVMADGSRKFFSNARFGLDGDGNFEAKAWMLNKPEFIEGGDFIFLIKDGNWQRDFAEMKYHREKDAAAIALEANKELVKFLGKTVRVRVTVDGKNIAKDTRAPIVLKWTESTGKDKWSQPFWRDMLPEGDFTGAVVTNSIPVAIPADAKNPVIQLGAPKAPASLVYKTVNIEEILK